MFCLTEDSPWLKEPLQNQKAKIERFKDKCMNSISQLQSKSNPKVYRNLKEMTQKQLMLSIFLEDVHQIRKIV